MPEPTTPPAPSTSPWRRRLLPAGDLLVLLVAYLSQTPRVLSLARETAPFLALLTAIAPTLGITTLRWTHDGRPLAGNPFPRLACASLAASRVTFVFVIGSWIEGSWRAGRLLSVFTAADLLASPLPAEPWAQYLSPRVLVWAFATSVLAGVFRKLEAHRAEAASEAALRREAQDVALRARLAPHFIFNALNTLKAQTELDPRAAGATADRLAALLRQVLERADRPTIPLREELEFVEAYLGIERARLGDRLRVRLEVAEDVEGVEVPPMALQALVENAVVHGIAPREEGGELSISAGWDGSGPYRKLRVRVENPVARGARPGTGTGLRVLQGRLFRPDDLRTEQRDDRFLAEFVWRGAAA